MGRFVIQLSQFSSSASVLFCISLPFLSIDVICVLIPNVIMIKKYMSQNAYIECFVLSDTVKYLKVMESKKCLK